MTDLPGARDDDDVETSEERLEHEVTGDDALGPTAPQATTDSAILLEEGPALAPPD